MSFFSMWLKYGQRAWLMWLGGSVVSICKEGIKHKAQQGDELSRELNISIIWAVLCVKAGHGLSPLLLLNRVKGHLERHKVHFIKDANAARAARAPIWFHVNHLSQT